MKVILYLHILSGAIGLLFGAVAISTAKGKKFHRLTGRVFVYAMLTMSLSGVLIALLTSVETSVVAGLLTAYLVITSLTTVLPSSQFIQLVNKFTLVLSISIGFYSFSLGTISIISGNLIREGMPVPALLIFGAVALFASFSDIRLIRSTELKGKKRIIRHLWRMCFALFIASASFFLGQADEIPEQLRITELLMLFALLPLLIMFYWIIRVRLVKNTKASKVIHVLE